MRLFVLFQVTVYKVDPIREQVKVAKGDGTVLYLPAGSFVVPAPERQPVPRKRHCQQTPTHLKNNVSC